MNKNPIPWIEKWLKEKAEEKEGELDAIKAYQALPRVSFVKGISPFCKGYNSVMLNIEDKLRWEEISNVIH